MRPKQQLRYCHNQYISHTPRWKLFVPISQMCHLFFHKLTDIIVSEVLHGADGTEIRCGVIGEIGTSWPITESEKKVLRATAHAQTQLGCPVIIHPGRDTAAPGEVIRILQEAGGDISKTVMSHLDR